MGVVGCGLEGTEAEPRFTGHAGGGGVGFVYEPAARNTLTVRLLGSRVMYKSCFCCICCFLNSCCGGMDVVVVLLY